MAQELRKISFNLTEAHAALEIFGSKTNQPIPEEEISSITPDGNEGTGRIAVAFGEESLVVRDKALIAALLIFCQQKSIPVPKEGKKLLKAEGSKLTMLIKF